MSRRATIYIDDATAELLDRLAPEEAGQSLSGAINQTLHRYHDLLARHMPALTKGEWCAIFDANNGGIFPTETNVGMIGTSLWANLQDSRGIGDKWEIDQKGLVRRLKKMEPVELLAIAEACSVFWSHTDLTTTAALKVAGCRMA